MRNIELTYKLAWADRPRSCGKVFRKMAEGRRATSHPFRDSEMIKCGKPALVLATWRNDGRRQTDGQRHFCIEHAIEFAQKHGIGCRIPTDVRAIEIYAKAEKMGDTSPERLRSLISSDAYFDLIPTL